MSAKRKKHRATGRKGNRERTQEEGPRARGERVRAHPIPGKPWIVGLCGVALLVSVYLLWGSLRGEHLPGCGPDSGCDEVLGSRWSSWLGVPVSLPALLSYVTLLGALAFHGRTVEGRFRERLALLSIALGSAILVAAIWFVLLQVFVIRAICPFCMVAHACGLVVGGLLLLGRRRETGLRVGVSIGVAATLVLVGGQIVYEPQQFAISQLPDSTLETQGGKADTPPASEREPISTNAPQPIPEPRSLQLYRGLFKLDLNNVPLIGSPDAPQIVLHFFDYSCKHCRALHPLLASMHHALRDRLAIVNLPIPLEPDCNPILKRHIPEHTNACTYARLGLAVWKADARKLPDFEDWIFSFSHPPHPDVVRQEAAKQVGDDALVEALQDPWIDEYLALSIRIYHTNYLRFGKSGLPLLMTDKGLVSGKVRSTNELYEILGVQP